MPDSNKSVRIDVRLADALQSGEFPKEVLIDGPAGTGKTFSVLCFLHCLLADYPGIRCLAVRQTRASLSQSVLVTYEQEVLPLDGMGILARGATRKNRQSYIYPNGSELAVGGLDRPDRILSTSWDLIYVNEAIELFEDGWDALAGRLDRPDRTLPLGFILGDTNPGDPSHWLKKRCDAGRIERWETDHKANPAMHDGVSWTEAGERYLARLDRYRGTRRKRFLEGIWAAGEGQWFDTFTDSHIDTYARYDSNYPVHLAIDSGVHTGAVWFQVRPTPNRGDMVTVFGDYYAFNLPAYSAAQAIMAKSRSLGIHRFDRGVTDPAGNSRNAIGPTVVAEYARAGLTGLGNWPSYPGSVIDGLSLIESFVAVDPPQLLIHPDCVDLRNAFANYKRKKRSGQWIDEPEDPQHPYEELMDSLRGGLQDRFPEGRKWKPDLPRVSARQVF